MRAGRARGQWWLGPLGWHDVAGFPARQVLIGVLVPVLFLLLLAVLARRSWRYEKVRPPFHGETAPAARQVAASTLRGGLADPRFWDGEGSVRSLTRVHLAAAAGFLAVVLGVCAKLVNSSGTAHWLVLCWIAVAAGGVAMAGAVVYLVLDALGYVLARSPVVLLIVGAVGLVSARCSRGCSRPVRPVLRPRCRGWRA